MNGKEYYEILTDESDNGRERPWREKKMANEKLSKAYDEVDETKAERLCNCGNLLQFKVNEDGVKKLHMMNSCRVRLCPMCAWRRSLKVYHNTNKIMTGIESEKEYGYIMLTLTVRNCTGEELSETITDMMKGWQRFIQTKAFRKAVKGTYRGLEITHNVTKGDPYYDTYHPHYHCVLVVDKYYFGNKSQYLNKTEWQQMWRKAMRLDYDPVIDVKRVIGSTADAVSEVAKYSVKDEEYLIPDDWGLTVDTVRILDSSLHKRRFVSYGGKMKEWHKRLNLEDESDGDLINVGEDDSTDKRDGHLHTYVWNTGYNQYLRGR
jgi:plasmid rolling circle replication initiator protein Rep